MVQTHVERSAAAGERLQKVLAAAGVDSRRKCEEYVSTGRVTVDGTVVTDLAHRVNPAEHEVRLDGERLRPQAKRYYLLNKPSGYLCTNRDPSGRGRAIDLLPAQQGRLFTVGRLDASSEGLLIVTNDGEFAQKLAHPRFQVPRVYKVQVAGVPSPATLAELRKGLHFSEGRFAVKRARRLKTQGKSSFIEVELTQGQNREIRRLFARVGHKVMWLQRIAFGTVRLGTLAPGRFRSLSSNEVKELMGVTPAKKSPRPKANRGKPRKSSTKRATSSAAKRPARRMLDLTEAGSGSPGKGSKGKQGGAGRKR